jgi:hypothetical protein
MERQPEDGNYAFCDFLSCRWIGCVKRRGKRLRIFYPLQRDLFSGPQYGRFDDLTGSIPIVTHRFWDSR